jgi:multiple sugar transport system permease protein
MTPATITQALPGQPSRRKRQFRPEYAVLYVTLAVSAFAAMAPLLWMLSTAFKGQDDLFVYPPRWLPTEWHWRNFPEALGRGNFDRYFFNSLIYAVASTLFNLLFASMAGYAFARLRFPGREVLFYAILATIMIPGQVRLIPTFVIMKHMPLAGGNDLLGQGGTGWIDTYAGLILPDAVTPFGIFLMRQFLQSIPTDLEDAARVDGANSWMIYTRIILPLSGPALATLAILTFEASWNDFTWPLIITSSDAMRTIQVGLQTFQDQNSTEWALLMAATVVSVAPLIILFMVAQRYFVRSLAMTGLKG